MSKKIVCGIRSHKINDNLPPQLLALKPERANGFIQESGSYEAVVACLY